LTQSFVGKLARHAGTIRSGVLSVAGFGLLTAAAFTYTTWAGLTAAGISCLLLDFTREKSAEPDTTARR
jgi:hypothetical protein